MYNNAMNALLNIYKPVGLTPLQMIENVRKKFPEYKNEKIGYAGRLDPLAHGLLLLMIGEATKERGKYLNLPKTYEFEAVFGIETDTYDLLGLLCHPELVSGSIFQTKEMLKLAQHDINAFIQNKLGKQTQPYPPYSSKTVGGKPLFWWAKNNKLLEIRIPEREIEIYDFKLLSLNAITLKDLKQHVATVLQVTGDFRQKEIGERWKEFFNTYCHPERSSAKQNGVEGSFPIFQTARFTISCSSGTYVRSLVHELGKKLGCGAITLEILRTKVGDYALQDSLKLPKSKE